MLVQYNCLEYQCEPDLVEKLIRIVKEFPPSVYLAPYPTMDAKIALAAPGRLLTLEILDGVLIHVTHVLQRLPRNGS
jgi:hypothetical protein